MSDDLSGFSLMELFRTEAEGQVAILSSGLLALEGAGASAATIEPLMRAAHSLKGAARIVGLAAAERVAHALEDVFVAAQKGRVRLGPHHVDRLLACVDLLSEVAQVAEGDLERWQAEHAGRIEETEAALRAIEAGTLADNPPPLPAGEGRPEISPSEGMPPAGAGTEPEDSTAAAPPPVEAVDRVVRVTAENLNRLMGLAGESLVEARQLRPIVDSLQALKSIQGELWDGLRALEDHYAARPAREARPERALLARIKHQAARGLEELGRRIERLEGHARRGEDLAERLHHEVIASRLRPLIDGIRGFPRLVRDLARQLGKQVRFEVVGEQTGVDRDILEKLEAPLNHLIRNALDHGIEPPEERRQAGKDPTATLRLEARHVAGMLQISLGDDGRGIDVERVRRRAVERGLVSPTMAARLAEPELLEFLFLAGFTTRSEVTELSGRGVGLDVVQSLVQAVGGSVRVATRPGRGACFRLQLPITMSVIRALLVTIAGEPYAFPLSRLERIEAVPAEGVEVIEGRPFFRMDDQPVGLVSAAQVLERPAPPASADGPMPAVVVGDGGRVFGVVVEAFLGERDLDVRPLDPRLGKVPNINGASVLEDGRPVLILDVEDLVRSIDNLVHGRRLRALPPRDDGRARRAARRVLVVDDSITVRELERQLLESRGYQVEVAVDGMDGWNAVRGGRYDLVVSDVDMPRLDGIALVRQIKQDPRLKAIPVVIVSYKDREEDRLRGLDAGADCYLTKSSFHDETFLNTVHDLIGEARG